METSINKIEHENSLDGSMDEELFRLVCRVDLASELDFDIDLINRYGKNPNYVTFSVRGITYCTYLDNIVKESTTLGGVQILEFIMENSYSQVILDHIKSMEYGERRSRLVNGFKMLNHGQFFINSKTYNPAHLN